MFCGRRILCWSIVMWSGNLLHKGLTIWYGESWLYIGFQLAYYMLGTTTVNAVSSSGVVVTLERNILMLIGLTVTEIMIKKNEYKH